jgi:hypothetical protein
MEDLRKALVQSVPLSDTMSEEIDQLRTWAQGRARDACTGSGGSKAAS